MDIYEALEGLPPGPRGAQLLPLEGEDRLLQQVRPSLRCLTVLLQAIALSMEQARGQGVGQEQEVEQEVEQEDELAIALRLSQEQERRRLDQEAQEEEEVLRQVLELSLKEQ